MEPQDRRPLLSKVLAWSKTGRHVVIPLAIIGGIGSLFLLCRPPAPSQPTARGNGSPIVVGHDYWVGATIIEVVPSGGSSDAPDLYYTLEWQGAEVFRSHTQSHVFVAAYSMLSLDVFNAVLARPISLETSVSAALVNASPDAEFTVRVFDHRKLLPDKRLGYWRFKLLDMHAGDNVVVVENCVPKGLKRMVVRIVDKSAPFADVVKELLAP